VSANQAIYPMPRCAVCWVSPSGYYGWLPSPRARMDAELTSRIKLTHKNSRATYGTPRIHAELVDEGIHAGRKRVARLMANAGLDGVSRRQWATSTVRDRNARPAPHLVERNFAPPRPIVCGSPISRTSRPGRVFSVSR